MTTTNTPPWLDDAEPHDPDVSHLQIEAIRALSGARGTARILDLGAGVGRVAIPLVSDGHDVVALDIDEQSLATCSMACQGNLRATVRADFTKDWPDALAAHGPYDFMLCVGNTLMLLHDIDSAVTFLRRCVSLLTQDGVVIIDDIPGDFWPEVAEGNWQAGVSEEDGLQMVWEPDDAVFALRMGDAVDGSNWQISADEQRYRLWTAGALEAVALCSGLSVVSSEKSDGLRMLRRI